MSEFKAVIAGSASKEMQKSNGGAYVLIQCEILDGPAKGKVVAGTLTTKNKDGVARPADSYQKGEEITLYHSAVPSIKDAGKFVHFFEIGSGLTTTDNEVLTELLGAGVDADQSI